MSDFSGKRIGGILNRPRYGPSSLEPIIPLLGLLMSVCPGMSDLFEVTPPEKTLPDRDTFDEVVLRAFRLDVLKVREVAQMETAYNHLARGEFIEDAAWFWECWETAEQVVREHHDTELLKAEIEPAEVTSAECGSASCSCEADYDEDGDEVPWSDDSPSFDCDCGICHFCVGGYHEYSAAMELEEDREASVCTEAVNLVLGDRQADYGHPWEDFTRTAEFWTTYLGDRLNCSLKPEDIGLMMVLLKISRQCNAPKRDNLVDGCGYLETVNRVIRERERREGNFSVGFTVAPEPPPLDAVAPGCSPNPIPKNSRQVIADCDVYFRKGDVVTFELTGPGEYHLLLNGVHVFGDSTVWDCQTRDPWSVTLESNLYVVNGKPLTMTNFVNSGLVFDIDAWVVPSTPCAS